MMQNRNCREWKTEKLPRAANCSLEVRRRQRRRPRRRIYGVEVPSFEKLYAALSSSRGTWAIDVAPRPETVLARLEEAASAKDERAFLDTLEQVEWKGAAEASFIHVIRLALKAGAYMAARQIANEGLEAYPESAEMKDYAAAFAPPTVVANNLPANPSLRLNRDWLRANANQYSGQWVALKRGELLGASHSFDELFKQVGRSKEILITRA
jgi:hypothetical protein